MIPRRSDAAVVEILMPGFPGAWVRLAVVAALMGTAGSVSAQSPVAPSAGPSVDETFEATPLWTEEQTPIEFLERAGQERKVRWRHLYRPPPATPSTSRPKNALTLGALASEAFLCLFATDSQQFRNNHQEIITFVKTLALGEKTSPRLLAQSKMAEMEQWDELKIDLIDGYVDMRQRLAEQRDEDLAVLVELGVWLRTLEILSAIAIDEPELGVPGWTIGSPKVLEELNTRLAALSETIREDESVMEIDGLLNYLWRYWHASEVEMPSMEVAIKTHERIGNTMRKVTLK